MRTKLTTQNGVTFFPVQRSLLRCDFIAQGYASGIPGSHLEVLDLQALLSLVVTLARRCMIVDNDPDRRNSQRIVSAAASVLADWPNNFFRLLRRIAGGMTDSSTGVARGRLGGIYRSLFSLRGITPTTHGDFLRIAFLDFIRNDWKPAFMDQRLMRRLRTGQPERFISKSAFARRYGIDTRAVARFLEEQGVPSRTFRWGKSKRKLIDSAAARVSPRPPGKIYRLRQAAAMIGVSIELLKRLKMSGDFEVNHLMSRTKPGFHELDIEAFIQKLMKLAPPRNPADPSTPKYVRFAIVARGWYGSVEVKANIVRAVLSRELPVVGNVDGTVAGLLVPYEGFQRLAHDERARASGDTRTLAETARQLECNTRSIRRLVELGWLSPRPAPKMLRITEESIAAFKKQYVSLVSIAKAINSRSWALKSFCRKCNLPMLLARQPSRNSSQAFIRADQSQELLCFRAGGTLKSAENGL